MAIVLFYAKPGYQVGGWGNGPEVDRAEPLLIRRSLMQVGDRRTIGFDISTVY